MKIYEIRGTEVVEVVTGELRREETVFTGCDTGSALAVGCALADYWEVPLVGRGVPVEEHGRVSKGWKAPRAA